MGTAHRGVGSDDEVTPFGAPIRGTDGCRRAMVRMTLVALLLMATGRASAQCELRGDVEVARIEVLSEAIENAALADVQVTWPPDGHGSFTGRLRRPVNAPIRLAGVPMHLAAVEAGSPIEPFLDPGLATAVTLSFEGEQARLSHGRAHLVGALPRCTEVTLGAPAELGPARPGNAVLGQSVPLFARPDRRAARATLSVDHAIEVSVLRRERGWTQLQVGAFRGWARGDPTQQPGSVGAGGFPVRPGPNPREPAPHEGCYLGPARLRADARIFAAPDSTAPVATVTDARDMLFEDCGAPRVEVVRLLGSSGHFGWVDGADVERVGLQDCGDGLLILQDRNTGAVSVLAAPPSSFRPGDLFRVIGSSVLIGLPFDTVRRVLPEVICHAWRDDERIVVGRGEQVIAVPRRRAE